MILKDTLLGAIDSITVGLALFNRHDQFLFCNQSFGQIYPELSEHLKSGAREDALKHVLQDPLLTSADKAVLRWLRNNRQAILRVQHHDSRRWLELRRQSSPHGWVLSITDITRQKQLETALKDSQQGFRNVVLENQMGILVVSLTGIVLLSNINAQIVLGRGTRDLEGEYLGLPLTVGKKTEIDIIRSNQRGVGVAEMTVTETVWEDEKAYLVMLHDITERKRTEEKITHIAYHDPLTGLPNRRLLLDRLHHALARAAREQDQMAVIFLDLDGFKQVNDTLGHSAGDRLLCATADRLRACMRKMDTLARIGGDEFVVLMEHAGSVRAVEEMTERLRLSLTHPFQLGERSVQVSTSIGAGLFPAHGDDAERLLACADSAMYEAKRLGKNRIVFYRPGLGKPANYPLLDADQLRRALDGKQLELHYLPQIALQGGAWTGLGAQLCWRRPRRGLLAADQFSAEMEDAGLMEALTVWMVGRVGEQIRQWRSQGLHPPPLALPLAAPCLESEPVRAALRGALSHPAVPAGSIELDIAEDALDDDIDALGPRLLRFTLLGVQLTLDDFAGSHLPLTMLCHLPFSKLKLSPRLTRDPDGGSGDSRTLRALCAMAKPLGIELVAKEPVDGARREALARLGCRHLQAQGQDLAQRAGETGFREQLRRNGDPNRDRLTAAGDRDRRNVSAGCTPR